MIARNGQSVPCMRWYVSICICVYKVAHGEGKETSIAAQHSGISDCSSKMNGWNVQQNNKNCICCFTRCARLIHSALALLLLARQTLHLYNATLWLTISKFCTVLLTPETIAVYCVAARREWQIVVCIKDDVYLFALAYIYVSSAGSQNVGRISVCVLQQISVLASPNNCTLDLPIHHYNGYIVEKL